MTTKYGLAASIPADLIAMLRMCATHNDSLFPLSLKQATVQHLVLGWMPVEKLRELLPKVKIKAGD